MKAKFTKFRKILPLDQPVTLMSGDSIQVRYRAVETATGRLIEDVMLIEDTVNEFHRFTDAAIFDAEVDGRYALGGLVIEAKR
jgi:hypothetical protein